MTATRNLPAEIPTNIAGFEQDLFERSQRYAARRAESEHSPYAVLNGSIGSTRLPVPPARKAS